MSAKPYRIEGKGEDSYVVDVHGAGVVVSVRIGWNHREILTGSEVMRIICDGLNAKAEGGEP